MSDYGNNTDAHDNNEFSYLNDFALLDDEPTSTWCLPPGSRKGKSAQDELFVERLESFIEGQMREIKSFATREGRSLDEIRKMVAVPHARYLFSLDLSSPSLENDNSSVEPMSNVPSAKITLAKISKALQLLHSTTNYDSLLLVVSPHSPISGAPPGECSWIGGTELGKEFWMGLKGGGLNGARAFRVKSHMRYDAEVQRQEEQASETGNPASSSNIPPSMVNPPLLRAAMLRTQKLKSGDVKNELYAAVRQALRTASGNPSAEMRWTKPASLEELYGVRLYGWPSSIDLRNPSNNTVNDNRTLLRLVQNGSMRFVKKENLEWNRAIKWEPSDIPAARNGSPKDRQTTAGITSRKDVAIQNTAENSEGSTERREPQVTLKHSLDSEGSDDSAIPDPKLRKFDSSADDILDDSSA